MEKELLDTFDAAKKAADSVDGADGDSPEVDRCVDALRRLRKIPVTTKVLVDTQVGKRLRALTKHPQDDIRTVAADLFQYWKNLVIEETARDSKSTNGSVEKHTLKVKQEAITVKVEKISSSGPIKRNVVERSESIKVEKRIKSEKVSPYESAKLENSSYSNTGSSSGSETPKLEKKNLKQEKQANVSKNLTLNPNDPPKLTSLVRCNNPARDKIRELLAEALSRVAKETFEDDREEVRNTSDEVEACDPLRVAVTVESAMFGKLGSSTGAQKMKYRSIMFNLKDNNNHDFRRKVLVGQVRPEEISNLSAEDMASDDRKLENRQIKEKALFECERAGAPKASTDQFKCGRCGQRKTTYYQLQTRSADEPMTTFVTCVVCNNHWKFC